MNKSKHLKKLFAGMMIAFLAVSCAKKKKSNDSSDDSSNDDIKTPVVYKANTSAIGNDVEMVMETKGDKPMTYLVTKSDKYLYVYKEVDSVELKKKVMAAVPVMNNTTHVKADALKPAMNGIFAIENGVGIYAIHKDKPTMATEMLVKGPAVAADADSTNTGKAMVSGHTLYYPVTTPISGSKLVRMTLKDNSTAVLTIEEVDKIFRADSGVFVVDDGEGVYAIHNDNSTKAIEKLDAGDAVKSDAKLANTGKAEVSENTLYYPVTTVIDSTKKLVGFNLTPDNMSTAVDNISAADKIFPVKGGVFVAEDGKGVRAVMNDNISSSSERLVAGGIAIAKADVNSGNSGKAMVSGDRLYYPVTTAIKGSTMISMTLMDNATETTVDIAAVNKIFESDSGVFVVDDAVGIYAIKNDAPATATEKLAAGAARAADAASGNTNKAMVSGDILYYPVGLAIKGSKMTTLTLDNNSKETDMDIAAVDKIFPVKGGVFVVDNGEGIYAIKNDNVSKASNRMDNMTDAAVAGGVAYANVEISMSKSTFFHEKRKGTLDMDNYTMLMKAVIKK